MPLLPRGTKSVVASVLEREPTLIPRGHWDGMDPMLNAEIVYPSGEMMRTGSAQIDTLEEQWEHKRAQVRPWGPGQVGFSRLVGGAQGTMGIVTWEAIRCRILPTLQRLYMIPSADIDPLVNTAYKILRHRYGDEVFFLNNLALAAVVEKKPEDIKALANELPEWVLMVGIAGYEFFPEERMEYQEEDIRDMAAEFAMVLKPAIAGAKGPEIIKLLSKPSEEPYWKNRLKGACHDIFFITTLDQVSKYVAIMHELAESFQYPTTDIGVYIQPMTQGVYCHCEFNLNCDPGNRFEADTVKKLLTDGAKVLADKGAFFSRPYYGWADIAYNHISSENVVLFKKAKAVFDPNGILNPGKLCF
jgi:FAD/FMN-containing dehydrogenase